MKRIQLSSYSARHHVIDAGGCPTSTWTVAAEGSRRRLVLRRWMWDDAVADWVSVQSSRVRDASVLDQSPLSSWSPGGRGCGHGPPLKGGGPVYHSTPVPCGAIDHAGQGVDHSESTAPVHLIRRSKTK